MKIILSVFIILISMSSFAQDSSNIRVSGVILKGRESDIVAYVVKTNPNDFPILDSVLKILYVTKPANGADVTFNSVPNKEWVRMIKKVSNNSTAAIKNCYALISAALVLNGGAFISHRIVLLDIAIDDDFQAIKKLGQNYAQKKDDGDSF
jgi:hypothetical protein